MEPSKKILLIAPCGMNCGVCMAHLRERNRCSGCRGTDPNRPITRLRCKIKNCKVPKEGGAKFCFECQRFPCDTLKRLDARYRSRYKTSVIENLNYIETFGVGKFLRSEKAKWTCAGCGGTICIHKGCCCNCGRKKI
jgi:hypothetical protein